MGLVWPGLSSQEIIGFEGIWGVLMMVVLVYPALWFIPGPDHGHEEDLVDTLVTCWKNVEPEMTDV